MAVDMPDLWPALKRVNSAVSFFQSQVQAAFGPEIGILRSARQEVPGGCRLTRRYAASFKSASGQQSPMVSIGSHRSTGTDRAICRISSIGCSSSTRAPRNCRRGTRL